MLAGDIKSFQNPLSFCVVIGSWLVVLLCSSVTWYLVRRKYNIPVLKAEDLWGGIKYPYLIRIRTGNCTVNFDHRTAKIVIRFLSSERKPIASMGLPANWISEFGKPDTSSEIHEMRTVTFYWQSPILLPAFLYLQVYHSCRVPNSAITVYDVDVRERYSSCAVKAFIGAQIEAILDENLKDQVFVAKPLMSAAEDDVDSPVSDFRLIHYLIMAMLYSSLSSCFSLIIPYSPKEFMDSTLGMINGAVAAPIAGVVSAFQYAVFMGMRKSFSPYFGQELYQLEGFWTFLWGLFALVTGVLAGLYAGNHDLDHTTDWGLGVLLSIFIFLGPFNSFYFIYTLLCKRNSPKRLDSRFFANLKKPHQPQDQIGLPRTPSGISIQSTGSSYFQQLLKDQNLARVKSISQYGALLAQQEPPPA